MAENEKMSLTGHGYGLWFTLCNMILYIFET